MNIKTNNIDNIKALMANILDGHNGENLYAYLAKFNHLNVGYASSAKSARESVPEIFRKSGFYITYYLSDIPTTEYFVGTKNDIDNWTDDNLWKISDGIGKVDTNSIGLNQLKTEVLDLIGKGNKITNYPDGEDLTSVDACNGKGKHEIQVLKFADKEYNPATFSGLGRKYLRKNIVDIEQEDGTIKTINLLTQDMINKPNTRYIIQYDYDLNGEEITVPESSILDFQQGSFNNGFINSKNIKGNSIKGTASIVNVNWKYIDIDEYYEGDLAKAINNIQNALTNNSFDGQNNHWQKYFINLRAGGQYELLSGNIKLNRRFSFGCINGIARINVNIHYENPTIIFDIVKGNEATYIYKGSEFCGMHFNITDATNAILFNVGNVNSNSINEVIAPNIIFRNISTNNYSGNPFYRIFNSYGYNDNYQFDNVNISHIDRTSEGNVPKQIDIQINWAGDGIKIENCGENTTFAFLHNNNVQVNNSVNGRFIIIGGNIIFNNFYSETGSIHTYKANVVINNSLIQNELLDKDSSIFLDYEPLLEESWIKDNTNFVVTAWGNKTRLIINNSNICNQYFSYVPKDSFNYKRIVNYNNNADIIWNDDFILNLQLRDSRNSTKFSYNREYVDGQMPNIALSFSNDIWYTSSRVDPNYIENRDIVKFDVYIYVDKERNIGIHRTINCTTTTKKFITLKIQSSTFSYNGKYIEIYKTEGNTKEKYTGYISSKNDLNPIIFYDSKYHLSTYMDKESFDNLPDEPISIISYKWINNNKNIEVTINSYPIDDSLYKDGDIIKLNTYYNNKYTPIYKKINGQFIYITNSSKIISTKQPNSVYEILDIDENNYEENKIVVIDIYGNTSINYCKTTATIVNGSYVAIYGSIPDTIKFYKKDNKVYLYTNITAQATLFTIHTSSIIKFIGRISVEDLESQNYVELVKNSITNFNDTYNIGYNINKYAGRIAFYNKFNRLIVVNKDGNWVDCDGYSAEYRKVGNTGNRPILTNTDIGFEYFDTSINKPIWWNGTTWVECSTEGGTDLDGAEVTDITTVENTVPASATAVIQDNKVKFTFAIPKGKDGAPGKDGTVPNWNTYVYKQSTTKPEKPTGTALIPSGWVDYPNNTGQWWQCVGQVNGATGTVIRWGEVLPLNGRDGTAQDGRYTEMRFAVNTNRGQYPTIDRSVRTPSGWTLAAPSVNQGQYLWMTTAIINPNDTLYTNWNIPVCISGPQGDTGATGPAGNPGSPGSQGATGIPGVSMLAKYSLGDADNPGSIRDAEDFWSDSESHRVDNSEKLGMWKDTVPEFNSTTDILYCTQGKKIYTDNSNYYIEWCKPFQLSGVNGIDGSDGKGSKGQIIYPAGIYNLNATYITTDKVAPYVLDTTDSNYYVLNAIMSWKGTEHDNLTPSQDYAINHGKYWLKFDGFNAVYAKIGIIANGLIGSTVFNGDWMFSQQGINQSGSLSTEYQLFNPNSPYSSDNQFRPNIAINFKTGEVYMARGNFYCDANGNVTIKGISAQGGVFTNSTENVTLPEVPDNTSIVLRYTFANITRLEVTKHITLGNSLDKIIQSKYDSSKKVNYAKVDTSDTNLTLPYGYGYVEFIGIRANNQTIWYVTIFNFGMELGATNNINPAYVLTPYINDTYVVTANT